MSITLSGFLCLFLFVLLIFHCRFKLYALITMPLFMVLLTHYRFFGYYKQLDLLPEVDVLLLVSLCVFLGGYTIGKRLRANHVENFYIRLSDRVLKNDKIFISHRCINLYLLFTIFYCVFDLWLNTQLYGSLENALIRFYAKPMDEDFPTFLKTIQGFLYKALIVFIFVFRFYLNKYHIKSSTLIVIVILLVLIAIPRGSRGAVVYPMLLLVMGDFFSFTFQRDISIRGKFKEYAAIGGLGIFLILSLTMIRNIDFEDISDVYDAVSELNIRDSADSYSKGEGELVLQDAQKSYIEFGHRVPFLSPFYTLETLILAPVPRVLMPSKKVSYGYVLNEVKLGGMSLDPKLLNYQGAPGWAAGLMGEGWANGGLFGVIFYSFLFGVYSGFCSKMYYKLLKSSTPLSLRFALLFFQMSFSFIRGDLLAGYVQGLYPLLIITFLFYIVGWRKLSYRERSYI